MLTKLQTHSRSYDLNQDTISGKLEHVIKDKNVKGRCCLDQRHVVALMGFIMCSLLNTHRLVMGVAIVAMVKHKPVIGNHTLNNTDMSCPLISTSENITNPLLEGEFEWSSELQGYVLGISFLGYICTQFLGGRLAEVWGAKRTIYTGNFMAAIFTCISPFASWWNVYTLIAVQFLRGLSQGLIMAAIFVLMANWFPRKERGFLSTIVVSGFAVGGTVGGLLAGWLCDVPQLGWQSAFYVCGVYSAVITIVFVVFIYETPQSHPRITSEELKYITDGLESDVTQKRPPTPWRKMFTSIPVYAFICGLFGHYWSVAYFLSVHPTYMGTVLHFPILENGAASSLPISMKSVGGLVASIATQFITKKNYMGVDKLRKCCNSIGAFGFSFCLLGAFIAGCNGTINIICFSGSLFCSGVALSGTMIASVDMSPTFAGSLMGISSTVASTSTFIIPVLVGALTKNETLAEWHVVFFISIAIVLPSGIVFVVFGSAEVQPWNYAETQDSSIAKTEYSNTEKKETISAKY